MPWMWQWLMAYVQYLWQHWFASHEFRWRRKFVEVSQTATLAVVTTHPQRKPDWVAEAVIRIAWQRPKSHCSYRKVADSFNRCYCAENVSVGKDYVGGILRLYRPRIEALRAQWRARKPFHYEVNDCWAMDITLIDQQPVLGVMDHGSRVLLCATPLNRKTACAIARCLIDVIERYGVPRALRTDNEGTFIAQSLKLVFKLFGILPQRTKPRSPWQNGRMERLFGTLKNEFMSIVNPSLPIDVQLKLFQHYYNQQRPHMALNGQTPAQVWNAAHRNSEWRGSG